MNRRHWVMIAICSFCLGITGTLGIAHAAGNATATKRTVRKTTRPVKRSIASANKAKAKPQSKAKRKAKPRPQRSAKAKVESATVHFLNSRAKLNQVYRVSAVVLFQKHCPICPKKKKCKPCQEKIVISDKPRTYKTAADRKKRFVPDKKNDLILNVLNAGGFDKSHRYQIYLEKTRKWGWLVKNFHQLPR